MFLNGMDVRFGRYNTNYVKVFDREGDGKVSSAELRRAMTGLGEKMSTREGWYLFE